MNAPWGSRQERPSRLASALGLAGVGYRCTAQVVGSLDLTRAPSTVSDLPGQATARLRNPSLDTCSIRVTRTSLAFVMANRPRLFGGRRRNLSPAWIVGVR